MFKPVNSNENFPEMEKKWLKHWYEKGIVKKYLSKNKNSKKYFSFLDGPITANNPMGVHHAWGRTYKDLWPRFYNLLGYQERFQNGFDCQGLWVEVEVEKELGLKTKKDIENLVPGDSKASIAKFVQLCKDRVSKFSKIQTEQSKRLGYFADWDNSYFTMSDENNYMIWNFLKKCYDHGWIYKGRESVPWCPRCETAISQHEMLTEDYKELVHESIYLELPLVGKNNEMLLVWTTTPWTIPANIAVAVDTEIEYSLVENKEGKFIWIAKDALKRVFTWGYKRIVKTVKGKSLIGLKYKGPFDDLPEVKKVASHKLFHTVIPTDPLILPITTVEGTGMVHTAVSAGVEDFKLGKKLGLPMIPVIADNADYLPNLGFLSGKNAKKHPEIILDYLKEKDAKGEDWVFDILPYKHRYPACWRCKSELVWKVEDEWYIAMDKVPSSKFQVPNKSKIQNSKFQTLRQRMIEVAKKIKWMPEFGLERELDWLKNMNDWLISKKNRYWGLALPIYECRGCGGFEVIGSKEELEKRAVSGWQQFTGHSPHKPFVDEVKIKCQKCAKVVSRLNDVGNPWLDAGIVAYSTIAKDNQGQQLYLKDKKAWRNWFPADFITESFPGQFKNWFYAQIAMSTVLENEPPFKRVLGFGTLLGEDGRPMHKSWGNAIEFNEGADKIGVDVMRWMFSRHNPADNILFGYKKADQVRRQFYLMLWNIYKFFVEYANLDKFQITNNKLQINNKFQISNFKNILDRWILSRFTGVVELVEKDLRNFSAKDAALEIEKFVSDLSTWFIRRSRDRVWVNSDDENDKNSFYTTLYYVLVNLSIIISPFIPFVAEEIYTNLTGKESVNLEDWPEISSKFKVQSFDKAQDDPERSRTGQSSKLEEEMNIARKVVEVGQAKRKILGVKIRIPLLKLIVKVDLTANIKSIPDEIWDIVLKELNVKNLVINNKKNYPAKEVKVTAAQLKKEGNLRELIRQIQSERKLRNLKPDDKINLTIPKEFEKEKDWIAKRVLAKKISLGNKVIVQ